MLGTLSPYGFTGLTRNSVRWTTVFFYSYACVQCVHGNSTRYYKMAAITLFLALFLSLRETWHVDVDNYDVNAFMTLISTNRDQLFIVIDLELANPLYVGAVACPNYLLPVSRAMYIRSINYLYGVVLGGKRNCEMDMVTD